MARSIRMRESSTKSETQISFPGGGRNNHLRFAAPMNFHEIRPGRDRVVAAKSETGTVGAAWAEASKFSHARIPAVGADEPFARHELSVDAGSAEIETRNSSAPHQRNSHFGCAIDQKLMKGSAAQSKGLPSGNPSRWRKKLSSENRKPSNGNPGPESRSTPRRRNAATASGSKPSPQGLLMGGFRESTTVTRRFFRVAAIAAASPAGPPPTTRTSGCNFGPFEAAYQRKSNSSAQKPGPIAARILRVPGSGRRWR